MEILLLIQLIFWTHKNTIGIQLRFLLQALLHNLEAITQPLLAETTKSMFMVEVMVKNATAIFSVLIQQLEHGLKERLLVSVIVSLTQLLGLIHTL